MKRRFNFTNRQRIQKQNIKIILEGEEDHRKISEATLDIKGLVLDEASKIYLEAYHRAEHKRFDLGTVGNMKRVTGLELSPMAYSENLKFRVLVVDESQHDHGLIVAHADRITAIGEDNKPSHSLLPVQFKDTGQEIWRLKFEDREGSPILYINSKIPNVEILAKRDPRFIMFVYPPVLKQILTKILLIDRHEFSEELDGWEDEWVAFAKMSAHLDNPPQIADGEGVVETSSDIEKWIDSAVEGFCYSRREWDGFIDITSTERVE